MRDILKSIVDRIMFNNSNGIKGAAFSCELLSNIYQGYRGEELKQLLEISEKFSMVDFGYSILEYNDKEKVFYYKE